MYQNWILKEVRLRSYSIKREKGCFEFCWVDLLEPSLTFWARVLQALNRWPHGSDSPELPPSMMKVVRPSVPAPVKPCHVSRSACMCSTNTCTNSIRGHTHRLAAGNVEISLMRTSDQSDSASRKLWCKNDNVFYRNREQTDVVKGCEARFVWIWKHPFQTLWVSWLENVEQHLAFFSLLWPITPFVASLVTKLIILVAEWNMQHLTGFTQLCTNMPVVLYELTAES